MADPTPGVVASSSSSSSSPQPVVNSGAGTTRAGSSIGDDMAKTTTKSSCASMDCPLRRCLAPVLRRRAEVGPEFTLLLNGIADTQRRLQGIETSMQESKFQLPLQAPFRHLAQYVLNTILPKGAATALEAQCVAELAPLMEQAQRDADAVNGETDAKVVYERLFEEAKQREVIFEKGLVFLNAAHDHEASLRHSLSKGQHAVLEKCRASVEYVQKKAAEVTQSSKSVITQLEAVRGTGNAAFDTPVQACDQRIKELEFKLAKSEANEEKILRRIREQYKELKKEQSDHESMIVELAKTTIERQRLSESRRQFLKSCDDRRHVLSDAYDACVFVSDVISRVTSEVEHVVDQCRLHVSRCLTDENFRKARMAKLPIDNAKQWYRAAGDMLHMRQFRANDLQTRMHDSWQLAFLLSSEHKVVSDSVLEMRAYQKSLFHRWQGMAKLLERVDIVVPLLHHIDKEDPIIEQRQRLAALYGAGKEQAGVPHFERSQLTVVVDMAEEESQQKRELDAIAKSRPMAPGLVALLGGGASSGAVTLDSGATTTATHQYLAAASSLPADTVVVSLSLPPVPPPRKLHSRQNRAAAIHSAGGEKSGGADEHDHLFPPKTSLSSNTNGTAAPPLTAKRGTDPDLARMTVRGAASRGAPAEDMNSSVGFGGGDRMPHIVTTSGSR